VSKKTPSHNVEPKLFKKTTKYVGYFSLITVIALSIHNEYVRVFTPTTSNNLIGRKRNFLYVVARFEIYFAYAGYKPLKIVFSSLGR